MFLSVSPRGRNDGRISIQVRFVVCMHPKPWNPWVFSMVEKNTQWPFQVRTEIGCTYCMHIYIYTVYTHIIYTIYTYSISADPSHLQGERAREKVALTILLHSGGSSLASNASQRLRRRLLLHSGSSVKCPAAPLPEAFAAFWMLSKSFSSGFRKQR